MMQLSSKTHLWLAARAMLQERGDDLFRRWDRARRSFELDDIHDLRVSSRRLREALAIFGPCFPAKSLSRVTSRVKRLTNILGILRNTDEAILYFTELVPSLPTDNIDSLRELLDELGNERDRERKNLKSGLKELDPVSLRTLFSEACNRPLIFVETKADPFVPIHLFLREAMTGHEASVCDLLPQAVIEANVNAQHKLRIVIKHFRYRFELAAPLISDGFNELHAVFRGYQEVLGRLHDLDVFADLVRDRFDVTAAGLLLAKIAEQRHDQFTAFERMLVIDPLADLGERVRGLL
ncbi:CHAD domain-containing protein [Geobacter argillaceus]|uniref:CHAD domain-containing protein n=1 Tax=Geobacter argillaceus TaxID=345631 RepID=A0A562VG07_9BACT|nr:CHAD domain-containing protein [Geobacter argillaceus]TWJ16856.1 CHAD domain-containing protein [Geobacter argillaceus]